MNVHYFTGKNQTSATARLRGYLIADKLKSLGMNVVQHEPPVWRGLLVFDRSRAREFVKHFRLLMAIDRNDVIYLVRTVFQFDFVLLVLLFRVFLRRNVIFDFDDTIYLKDFCRYRSRWLTRLANTVVVGSGHLAIWASKRNSRVYIIPTAIPYDIYKAYTRLDSPASSPLVIGWTGHGKNHVKNLRLLIPIFRGLIDKKILFKFILVGGMGCDAVHKLFADLKELDITIIDSIEWDDPRNIAGYIQTFDIGVMPLVRDPKTEGKCALKAIEYMACAVPAIVSPVGANKSLIKDGIDGWHAESTEDWISIISGIVDSPSVISTVGKRAQEKVQEEYSYDAIVPRVKRIIEEV